MNQGVTQGLIRKLDVERAQETREVEFILSTNTRDRYGTVLNQANWRLDNFNNNPVIGYMHNVYGRACEAPDPDDVIGSGRAWVEGGMLLGSVRFEPAELNAKADKVFRKVLAGTLRTASVGFMPFGKARWGKDEEARDGANPTLYYEGQELLEWSIVNIPGNPEALARGLRDHTAHALMYVRSATGLSFSEIERLSVGDLIRRLNKGDSRSVPEEAEEVSVEAATAVEPPAAPETPEEPSEAAPEPSDPPAPEVLGFEEVRSSLLDAVQRAYTPEPAPATVAAEEGK